MTRARRTRPWAAIPFELGPAFAGVGLLLIGAASVALLTGSLPVIPGGGPDGAGGPFRTPTPSNVVVVDPRTRVPGSLLYVKSGNVWVQSGSTARQLTDGGADAMPTWSPGGQWVYFIRTKPDKGRWVSGGEIHAYDLSVPSLMRLRADGTGQAEELITGIVDRGTRRWSYFLRQPAISPDGKTAALVTDGPDPSRSDIVLKLLDLATAKISDPNLPEREGLGHQDPVWAGDGRSLLFVRNAREGVRGTPAIMRYTPATARTATLTGPGYTNPALSRDGRFLAATKTGAFGTDIVILDARTGAELLRLTRDERSFYPLWSPMGDAIAFLKVTNGVVDLYQLPLQGAAPNWTVGEPLALTVAAGLAAESRPAWFVPPELLPTPPPTPAPTASAGAGGSPSPSP